ncbi:MAG: hypothetical protein HZR80_02755 [Candidatus Heimdallarchaeota archaeon]
MNLYDDDNDGITNTIEGNYFEHYIEGYFGEEYAFTPDGPIGDDVIIDDKYTWMDPDEDYDNDGLLTITEILYNSDPFQLDSDGDGLNDNSELNYLGTTQVVERKLTDSDRDNQLDTQTISLQEIEMLSNPSVLDSDLDGLGDKEEDILGLDPFNPDSDGDTLLDGWEVYTYAVKWPNAPDEDFNYYKDFVDPNEQPSSNWAAEDIDGDGLNNSIESSLFTNPYSTDTDNDGLSDSWEYENWLDPTDEYDASYDHDCDGLSTLLEATVFETNMLLADTDADGINDFEEINTYNTDPLDADSDNDYLLDGEEVYTYLTDPNDIDSDNDGLFDGPEINIFSTNPNNPDSDGDGLDDFEECFPFTDGYITNPNNCDTDNDGMDDYWEVTNSLDPLHSSDASGDPDGDGLLNVDEYFWFTDPHNTDSDGDGLPDGWEVQYGLFPFSNFGVDGASGDPDGDMLTNIGEYNAGTDPFDYDCDDDGLSDYEEVNEGSDLQITDPWDPDSDDDGLDDFEECHLGADGFYTNANNHDTDDDGLTDFEEFSTANGYVTDPTKADTDDEGLTDFDEIYVYGTDPTNADPDGDLLTDYREVLIEGTNPFDADTDNDGYDDGYECIPENNWNPTDTFDPDHQPTVFVIQMPSPTELQVNWQPMEGAYQYKVMYQANGETTWTTYITTGTSMLHTGLEPGTIHTFLVYARSSYNNDWSSGAYEFGWTRQLPPPTPVISLSNKVDITVQYFVRATPAPEVQLWWMAAGGSWQIYGTYTSNGSVTIQGLNDYTWYYFKTRQRVAGMGWTDTYWSGYSGQVSLQTQAVIPHSVRNFRGMSDTIRKITFSWIYPDNFQSGWYYKIWRGTSLIKTTTSTLFNHYPPSTTTTYTYKIACYNAYGQRGPYSYWRGSVTSGEGGGPI